MKADHKTIMLFGIKVMSKYKVLSKRERGVIKTIKLHFIRIICHMITHYINYALQ